VFGGSEPSMKDLLLMRHAKSDWGDDDLKDHERPLAKRGKRDASAMAKHLLAEKVFPKMILCSTAERARQTADSMLAEITFDGKLFFYNELYASSVARYLKVIRGVSNGEVSPLMIVGHNPEMEEALFIFTGFREHFPTCCVAWLQIDIQHWSELPDHPRAQLKAVWRPKEIDGE
jgi:phosphohistidine phosphatase